MVDIIIPVLNEEKILTEQASYFHTLKRMGNVLFVDGGSQDRTVDVAGLYGEVVSSQAGRGRQKNLGADQCRSNHLLFLHVDSFVDENAVGQIDKALSNGTYAGCLTMEIQDPRFIFRIYESVVNWRAKFSGVIDGDLGMFVKKDIFDKIGGFDHLTIMDDIAFSRKLRKSIKISMLPQKIRVSSRKWHDRGFGRTLSEYTLAYIKYWFGLLRTPSSNGKSQSTS